MKDLDLMILSACRYVLKESSLSNQDIEHFKAILEKAKGYLKEWQIHQQLNEADSNLWWREDDSYKYVQLAIKSALLETSSLDSQLSDSELEVIYLYATLYAIGRLTYIVDCALDWTLELSPKITQSTKDAILKRIEECRATGRLGMRCDVETWNRVEKELAQY